MPTRRIRCNVNASNDWYFPSLLGDKCLRDREDARRGEHSPPPWRDPQVAARKWRNADRSISWFRRGSEHGSRFADSNIRVDGEAVREFRARSRSARPHPRDLLPWVEHDWEPLSLGKL